MIEARFMYNGPGGGGGNGGNGGTASSKFIGGFRSTAQGTIFKRELKTGDTLQGSDIIDAAVAQQFGDIYDGQITFLPKYERTATGFNLTIGEVPIGNTYASGDYIIETPIKKKPPFGAGTLMGLDVNLYHDDLNYNMEQALPDIEVYKFNRTISNLVQGNFGRPRTENVIIGSTNYVKTPLISEIFDGADPFSPTSSAARETGEIYMFAQDAYNIQSNATGVPWYTGYDGSSAGNLIEFKKRYCYDDGSGDRNICRLETDWSASSRAAWVQPTKGVHVHRNDPNWNRYYIDAKYCEAQDDDSKFVQNYIQYVTESIPTVWDLSSIVTGENSIFSKVSTQGDVIDVENRDEQGRPAYINWAKAVFSNASHSGTCLSLSTRHKGDVKGKNTNQIAMGYFRLPKPLEFIREHSEAAAVNSLEVDIKFNIEKMTKVHQSDHSSAGPSCLPDGLNMFRSFIIMAATRPPDATEMADFGKYIRALNGPSDCSHTLTQIATGSVHGTGNNLFFPTSLATDKENPGAAPDGDGNREHKNHYNGICMMRWQTNDSGTNIPDDEEHASSNGHFAVNWSCAATSDTDSVNYQKSIKRRAGWGAVRRGYGSGTNYMPWVPKKGCESYADDTPIDGSVPEDNFNTPLATTNTEDEIAFLENNWYTWRMIINNKASTGTGTLDQGGTGEGDITWVLLDNENKVVTSRKQKHVGYRSAVGDGGTDLAPSSRATDKLTAAGSMPADMTNEKGGFPAYVSIWLLDMPKGGFFEDTDISWTTATGETSSSIFIDSIKISGFEANTSNATIGPRNDAKGSISINSSTEETIDTDKTFTDTENPPIFSTPIPSYISWGTNDDIFAGTPPNKNNIFMGGFTVDNPLSNDYTDTEKTMKVLDRDGATGQANVNSDIILRIPNTSATGQKKFGYWTCSGADTTLSAAPNFNEALLLDSTAVGVNYVDDFTKKGFFTIDFAYVGTSPTNYTRRENPLFSTKILEVIRSSPNAKIRVANAALLNGFYDDEFIVYRAGYDYDSSPDYAKTGLKVVSLSPLSNTIQLDGSIKNSTGTSSTLGTLADSKDFNLHELYISPYRFWFALEIFNTSEASWAADGEDRVSLPGKGYNFSVIQSPESPDSPMPHEVGNIFGMTYNESHYSDTSSLSNRWKLYQSTTGALVETGVDYGFGSGGEGDGDTIDDEAGIGYIRKYVPQEGYNAISLDGLVDVESSRLDKPDEKISLYIKASDETRGSCAIRSTKYTGSDSDPYFTFYYFDEKPTIENFLVKPNEDDPFYPTFTWDTQDDDLWYGFLLLSNNEIKHQYDGAVAHIPLNETNVTNKDKIYLYRYDGSNGGLGVTANSIGINNLTTVEGLAGNAFKCEGNNTVPSFITWPQSVLTSLRSGSYTQPKFEFSLVTHFTCDSIAANRYIVSKSNEFSIYVDTSGNINATLTPGGGSTTVTLKSSSLVNTDGETPMSTILTFDRSIATGNVKLFINGKLEDQSGIKTAAGSVNNWKAGEILNHDVTTNLTIGMSGNVGTTTLTPGSEMITATKNRDISATPDWVVYNPGGQSILYTEDTSTDEDIHFAKYQADSRDLGIELGTSYFGALTAGKTYRLSAKLWVDASNGGLELDGWKFQLGDVDSTEFTINNTPTTYTVDVTIDTDTSTGLRIYMNNTWRGGSATYPLWHMDDFSMKLMGVPLETPTTGNHSGTIEEVVLYDKVIYPVVPQTGELTLYKPLFELTISDVQSGISNVGRLFVKDYHNIRGTLANDVASSSMVSYRKSGLGLSAT